MSIALKPHQSQFLQKWKLSDQSEDNKWLINLQVIRDYGVVPRPKWDICVIPFLCPRFRDCYGREGGKRTMVEVVEDSYYCYKLCCLDMTRLLNMWMHNVCEFMKKTCRESQHSILSSVECLTYSKGSINIVESEKELFPMWLHQK